MAGGWWYPCIGPTKSLTWSLWRNQSFDAFRQNRWGWFQLVLAISTLFLSVEERLECARRGHKLAS